MKYPAIRIEGAILSPDIIDRIEEMTGQRPADFGLPTGTKVKEEIALAWGEAQVFWKSFQRKLDGLKTETAATTETRNNWVVPFLGLLKYDLELQRSAAEFNGKTYAISHRVINRAETPVHIVGIRDKAGLDRKPENATLRMSAHALVQEYLNLHDQLYGIVTNGRILRLLRDSSRLVKLSYLEFDLERIFTDGLFADFAVMYRLLHGTRLPATNDAAAESLIEKYHQDSLESGARIRDGLSQAVENAILAFGNGFLTHPANDLLRQEVASGDLGPAEFYHELLRLIYRLLFLMVIEERDLVFPREASLRHRDYYNRFYSVQRLRNLAERTYLADKRQRDLWQGLVSAFHLFEADGPGEKIGLKPLAGDLFKPSALHYLAACQLGNDVLLKCLRSLGLYQHPDTRQMIRVNYGALNVEEFGSVYEGLLEQEARFDTSGDKPLMQFVQGDKRSATGSHYTPDDLVQPLIEHSLDHLIEEKLKAGKTSLEKEKGLLDLRVADIACGSGHILLAAARRIATELAIVRTGEEQPSPDAFRKALGDVIRTCIYGVDLNPLAVELCKVALWLESHSPGEPLHFLDHHIKCGNAIVGYVKAEEVDKGVPEEAFAKLPEDDPEVVKKLRAQNKNERKAYERDQGRLQFTADRQNQLQAVMAQWNQISAMPEGNPQEIEKKQEAYQRYSQAGGIWQLKQAASIPVAQFYLAKTEQNESKVITDREFSQIWTGKKPLQGEGIATAAAVADKKRFFHWFLEFPEIIQRGGFDCILGNPPYLGGTNLSGNYGYEFCNWVRFCYAPVGLSELVVYFIRRYSQLLNKSGITAFITTNSIKDGAIREDSLDYLVNQGRNLGMAIAAVRWPGKANLFVSLIALSQGIWNYPKSLNGRIVRYISTRLEAIANEVEPEILAESKGKIFEGVKFLGEGFLLKDFEAASLISANRENSEVIYPFFDSKSAVDFPNQKAERWIINFGNRSEEDAKAFTEPFRIIRDLVKPIREEDNREQYRRLWWLFAERRKALSEILRSIRKVFVAVATAKYLGFSRFNTNGVFGQALKIFTTDRWDLFSCVQSTIHEVWARKYSGALKQDLRYSPSNCFESFAFPKGLWAVPNNELTSIGEQYHEHRRHLMLSLWLGLTDVYNLFHSKTLKADLEKHFSKRAKNDPSGESIHEEHRQQALAFTLDQAMAGIGELRRLHVEMDRAVLKAYGWHEAGPMGPGIQLKHEFYEVETLPENDRVRYTISPEARKELLKRLLQENLARAKEEEAAKALVATEKPARKPAKGKKPRATISDEQGEMFEGE